MNIVCGGYDGDQKLSDCEVNIEGEVTWSKTVSLPVAMDSFQMITVDNRVLAVGKMIIDYCIIDIIFVGGWDGDNSRDEILEFDTESWRNIARMKKVRYGHSISVMSNTDTAEICKSFEKS